MESWYVVAFAVVVAGLSFSGEGCEPAKAPGEAPAGCEAACAHLAETGKKDAHPQACDLNPKSGAVRSCVELCRTVEAHGQSFSTLCLSRVRTCSDVAACGSP